MRKVPYRGSCDPSSTALDLTLRDVLERYAGVDVTLVTGTGEDGVCFVVRYALAVSDPQGNEFD